MKTWTTTISVLDKMSHSGSVRKTHTFLDGLFSESIVCHDRSLHITLFKKSLSTKYVVSGAHHQEPPSPIQTL